MDAAFERGCIRLSTSDVELCSMRNKQMYDGIVQAIRKIKTQPDPQPARASPEQGAAIDPAQTLIAEFEARLAEGMGASKAMGCVLSGRLRPLADQGKPHKFDDLTADLLSATQAQERALAALVTALIDSKLAKAEFVIGVIGECFVAHDSDPDQLRRVAEYVADGSFDRYALIKRLWAKAMPEPTEPESEPQPQPTTTPDYEEDYMSAADPASDSQEAERQRAEEQQRVDRFVQA
jgi:hypothetical protein